MPVEVALELGYATQTLAIKRSDSNEVGIPASVCEVSVPTLVKDRWSTVLETT